MMKPSDNPLSPFSPHYQPKIDWRGMQIAKNSSDAMTNVVNNSRKKGIEPGSFLMEGSLHLQNARKFVVKVRR